MRLTEHTCCESLLSAGALLCDMPIGCRMRHIVDAIKSTLLALCSVIMP